MKLRQSGRIHAARICKEAALTSPTRAAKMLNRIEPKSESTLTAHEALSVLLNTNVSKSMYNYLCSPKRKISQIIPILKKSIRSKTDILSLWCNHQRLWNSLFSIFSIIQPINGIKWRSQFTKNTSSHTTLNLPDEITLMGTSTIIWQNPIPSSVYCRPLRLKFMKETPEHIRSEHSSIEQEIEDLQPTVNHQLILTMVDGKVCQALSNTPSSSTCFLCLSVTKPSKMNNIGEIKANQVRRSI